MGRNPLAPITLVPMIASVMGRDDLPLDRRLRQEILFARERVYRFGQPTPMERLIMPGADTEPGPEVWVKREDLSPVKSYKWRGACNAMTQLSPEQRAAGVVTASAGNHAQGVALAAKRLGIHTRIYMPRSTPKVKQNAVRLHGGEWVTIRLAGDSYDEAVMAAREDQRTSGAAYVHAYDDLQVMAGQGTLADELVLSGQGPFDIAYLQIGGGGMASAVSCWLKTYWPAIEIIGVEGVGQASMKAALDAGQPIELRELDIFCDGTAVRKAGTLPFGICQSTMYTISTVTNAEVSAAIRVLWETLRCISEPSGAMGLAAVLKNRAALAGKKVLIVITGANIDFLQLGLIDVGENVILHVTWKCLNNAAVDVELTIAHPEDSIINRYGCICAGNGYVIRQHKETKRIWRSNILERMKGDISEDDDLLLCFNGSNNVRSGTQPYGTSTGGGGCLIEVCWVIAVGAYV
jgi:threonine dehydratase